MCGSETLARARKGHFIIVGAHAGQRMRTKHFPAHTPVEQSHASIGFRSRGGLEAVQESQIFSLSWTKDDELGDGNKDKSAKQQSGPPEAVRTTAARCHNPDCQQKQSS